MVRAPNVRARNAHRDSRSVLTPHALVYGASIGLHQKSFQPVTPRTRGSSSAAMPKSCGTSSSARNAPMGPMKLRAGPLAPALKKGAGSPGLKVARLIRSIKARANELSPRNSASWRDRGLLAMRLDLHHHGNDHGPALGALAEEPAQLLAESLAGEGGVVALLFGARRHRFRHQPARIQQETRPPLVGVHEAAGHDLGRRLQTSRLLVEDDHRHHDAFRGEVAP